MPLLLLVFLAMCFLYPPMIGLGMGIGGFCLLWWVTYRVMGGE